MAVGQLAADRKVGAEPGEMVRPVAQEHTVENKQNYGVTKSQRKSEKKRESRCGSLGGAAHRVHIISDCV